jgi:uncharacterized membrane protein YfcA
LLLLGFVTGLLAGLLGLGGGIIIAPVLLFLFEENGLEHPHLWSIASSLICVAAASISSSWQHVRKKNIRFSDGMKLGLGGLAGTFAGKAIVSSAFYSKKTFAIVFSVILIATLIDFMLKGNRKEIEHPREKPMSLVEGGIIGFLGGVLASLGGVGGGIVMVPLLNRFAGFSFLRATGLSSFSIVLISISASIQMAMVTPEGGGLSTLTFGYVDFGVALPLAFASVVGAFFSVNTAHRINPYYLRWTFMLFILLVLIDLLSGL